MNYFLKKEILFFFSKKGKTSSKNIGSTKERDTKLITSIEDDEENDEFLRKYQLFKEKYLLKECLKPSLKKNPKKNSLTKTYFKE